MKILLVNKFLYPKGGDAICTLEAARLLRERGHEVVVWGMAHPDNTECVHADCFMPYVDFSAPGGIIDRLRMAGNMLYSRDAKKRLHILLARFRPDIAHVHNFAHQISPSILHVFKKKNIPCVMTMHDYKLVCASYKLLSHNSVCEKCAGGRHYRCFFESCVKNSRFKSLLNTAEMYLHHHILHIYDSIAAFISPSVFLKEKLKEMGFCRPVTHIPNFIDPAHYIPRYQAQSNALCYVGRLSQEKRLKDLIDAMEGLRYVLHIIGDGPDKQVLMEYASSKRLSNVHFLGYKKGEELKSAIRDSLFSVLPSGWYENNPLAVIEAYALGKPVIGACIGGIPELVRDNETGFTYTPGDVTELREKIKVLADSPSAIKKMGENARHYVENELNADTHYSRLMDVYNAAMSRER